LNDSEVRLGTQNTILIFGVGGMLGSAIFRLLSTDNELKVYGTARGEVSQLHLPARLTSCVVGGVDALNADQLAVCLDRIRPDAVINCVGLVKQLEVSNNVLDAVPLNTLLPHRLARLCSLVEARLIHMSTDCVFSGSRGLYTEADTPDAEDVYGRSKLLGEPTHENTFTLRTSIIGHELSGARSLINWFLSQSGSVRGYTQAIFSGLPTVEIARIIRDYVLPRPELSGLYHVSADPISKFALLRLVADVYKREIAIEPDDSVRINRSLDSSRFRAATGFLPEPWPEMIRRMHDFG
jgi:dTDP-4-dehydrorhamnose reductase